MTGTGTTTRSTAVSGRRRPPAVRPWTRLDGGPRRDQIAFLRAAVAAHGDVFRFRRMGVPFVMVNHPDLIERVLVGNRDNYDKNAILFKVVRPVLRTGLIANPGGANWARQRRIMQPHLRPATVARFAANMTDEAERLVGRWRVDPGPGGVVNVTDDFGALALRIVNRSLFSADIGDTAPEFTSAFLVANEEFARFFRFPFPPLGVPTPSHRRMRAAIRRMDAFVADYVQRPRDGSGPVDDLMSMLMYAVDHEGDGRPMDTDRLHDEILNLLVGAYETTTNSLSWVFYLLARHPEAERRLHDELDTVLGGRSPTFDDYPKLTYTRRLVDETLRLYSPAWQTMRHAIGEDELGGYRIAAGSNIYLNSYLLHRHPDFWPDPETFDPDRFAPERAAGRPKHAYIPFGSGERVCIGKHFALTEIALVTAAVAQRFTLELPPGAPPVRPLPLITLHPEGGVRLKLRSR